MAKRFRFRLETLLRVRQLREDEALRNVAVQQAEIARIDGQKTEMFARIQTAQGGILERQRGPALEPADLARRRAWIAHLRRQIADNDRVRAEKLEALDELRDTWRTARTQKRIIEKLRERRYDEHRLAENRRVQHEYYEMAQRLHVRGGDDATDNAEQVDFA